MNRRTRRPRRIDSRSLRILLSLGIVVGLGATGTFAAWTDSVQITGTTITSGTIELKVNNARPTSTAPSSMSLGNMVPGNSTAGIYTISNTGTAPLKYWIDAAATNTLGTTLVAKVTNATSTSGSSPSITCGGTEIATSNAGKFAASLLGTSTTGRTLLPGSTETLCIQATLPTGASQTLAGTTSNVTFTVTGTSY